MFLRFNRRFKDGKEHRYWNIVENKRCGGGKVVQRQVLYLGEINDSQHEAWYRQIEAFDEDAGHHTQLFLGLLQIEWVILVILRAIPVFDGDAIADW